MRRVDPRRNALVREEVELAVSLRLLGLVEDDLAFDRALLCFEDRLGDPGKREAVRQLQGRAIMSELLSRPLVGSIELAEGVHR